MVLFDQWRKVFLLFVSMCLAISFYGAAEADYSQFEIGDRFTPVDLYLLHGTEVVAETWPNSDGRVDMEWHVTWFRNGGILREADFDPLGNIRYYEFPHTDGTCGILKMETEAAGETAEEGIYLTLYDWEENGLTNPRLITDSVSGLQIAFDCFSVWKETTKTVEIFDVCGNRLFTLNNVENSPIRLAKDSLGNIWIMTVVYNRNYYDNTYTLCQIRDGFLQWEKQLNQAVSLFPDQRGGLYYTEEVGRGSYRDIGITHLDNDGNVDLEKSISANRVVIGCSIYPDSGNGRIVLAGRAVANSRKVYKVYCMTVDQDWRMLDLDVRRMDYYHDYNLSVMKNLDGDFFVHANGMDEKYEGRIYPVLVPFDYLEKTDNPGITLH